MAAEVTILTDGDVVRVSGELDTHTSPQLAQHFATIDDSATVQLDLAETSFISSAGLSVILNTQRRLAAGGGSLEVVAVAPNVARLVELSGLADAFGLS